MRAFFVSRHRAENAIEASVYHLQSLTLNSGARVQVIGPVIVRVANGVTLNGPSFGEAARPEWSERRYSVSVF